MTLVRSTENYNVLSKIDMHLNFLKFARCCNIAYDWLINGPYVSSNSAAFVYEIDGDECEIRKQTLVDCFAGKLSSERSKVLGVVFHLQYDM
jgi:hypothetical protein